MRHILALAVITGGLLVAGSANAALIVTPGNIPQTDDNVISNACTGQIDGPANLIKGCFNTNHNQGVTMTSTQTIQYAGGGQAVVLGGLDLSTQSPNDTVPFSNLKIAVDGKTFTSLILNIDADVDGQVQFNDGTNFSALFDLDGNGSNFFTITGGPFSFIELNTFNTAVVAVGIDDAESVGQIRIGGLATPGGGGGGGGGGGNVPEPATLALFGAALVGLGLVRRRRA